MTAISTPWSTETPPAPGVWEVQTSVPDQMCFQKWTGEHWGQRKPTVMQAEAFGHWESEVQKPVWRGFSAPVARIQDVPAAVGARAYPSLFPGMSSSEVQEAARDTMADLFAGTDVATTIHDEVTTAPADDISDLM